MAWINFKELRERLEFEAVLRLYGVEVKRRGDQHIGYCPLPRHGGNKNSPSFSANLQRGIFQCFGCGLKGNILEFAAYMENVDPQDGTALRRVAVRLQEHFLSNVPNGQRHKSPSNPIPARPGAAVSGETELPKVVNPVLDFELKGLDQEHPYLLTRGFIRETVQEFGLGFCSRGMLKDRIAVPLRNQDGELIGYAGRVIDDALISDENPRYRFPGSRVREGKSLEFRKSEFLYNGYRHNSGVEELIVVEGFTAAWWLHQNGYPNVVATMGASCSEHQMELIIQIVKPFGRVWIMADGDAAGERFTQSLLLQVAQHRFVASAHLASNQQPTDLSAEQLKRLLRP